MPGSTLTETNTMKNSILVLGLLAGGCHAVPAYTGAPVQTIEDCVERSNRMTCRRITEQEKHRLLEERGVANQPVEAPYIGGMQP